MPNRLSAETSAYLLQHQANPVDWYAWGPEPWRRAVRENKPVLVSIGYSSCHWCHVMEHESFENEAIAELMNRELICIKVDREERPDVDQIYMDAVVRLTRSGGWPLNVFCTPDGRPFHGGTYFPPERRYGRPSWPEVVQAIANFFREQPDQLEEQAQQLLASLEASAQPDPQAAAPAPGHANLTALCIELMRQADSAHGGFGTAPKFPTPVNLESILFAACRGAASAGAAEHVLHTCKRISRGGIFDQIGGGFHRYSTDARWLVPHFEKMLYDQGQLLRTFAEAFRQMRDDELIWPVAETVEWLEREMLSPQHGLYASQDADSEGEEGIFYVWDRQQVQDVLGPDDAGAFCDAYGVTSGGTFEQTGRSVLEHALAGERPRFARERRSLFEARCARIAPATDRKQIAAWSAYMIGGLALSASCFERPDWLALAERCADSVLDRLHDPDLGLQRIWDDGGAKIPAFLDDHAAWLCAMLDLHRAGGEERFIESAIATAERICRDFFDADRGSLFFTAGDDATLVMRPESDSDGATPSATGLAALGLVRVAGITGREDLLAPVHCALAKQAVLADRVPSALPSLIRAGALLEHGLGVGVVIGDPSAPERSSLASRARELLGADDAVVVLAPGEKPAWLATEWLTGREPRGDEPVAFVCRGRACSLPATTPGTLELPQV